MSRSWTALRLSIQSSCIAVILAGCSPGGLFSGKMLGYPTRTVPITAVAAQEGLAILTEPQPDDTVHLTESQFSSLLTQQIQRNADTGEAESKITVWFEPQTIYLQATLPQGAVPAMPTATSFNLVGTVNMTQNGMQVALDRAGIGIFPAIPPAVTDFLNGQIKGMLNDINPEQLPLDITVDRGSMTIHLRDGSEP